jgi:periplasmic protein TonB
MSALESSLPMVSGRFSLPYAALAALFLEMMLVASLVIGLSDTKRTTPLQQQPVMLTFPAIPTTTPPKPVQTPPRKSPVKPAPRPLPKPVQHAVHHHPAPPVHKAEATKPLVMAPATPNSVPAPTEAAPVAQTDKPSQASVDPNGMTRFEEQIHEAIQAAIHYPYAARVAHIEGRAQVSFVYIDGRVSAIKIIRSSNYDMFDSAAVQAVLTAHYPPPPQNLVGRSQQFEFWVRFDQIKSSSD